MRYRRVLAALPLAAIALVACSSPRHGFVIGVTQHRPASWADAVRSGFDDGLREAGWRPGVDYTIRFKSADGDQRVMRQIIDQFVQEPVDLIFAISTQSAQTAKAMTSGIPLIFGAVTDPVAAGLVASLGSPGGNTTGTSDQWPLKAQLLLLQELRPSVARVGTVHNPGESNSVAQLKLLDEVTRELGWELVVATANSPSEVYRATQTLVGRCDGLYVPADNTAIEAADAMAKVAQEAHLPIVAGEDSSVGKGAIATYSVNYTALGRLNAQQALAILRDHKVAGTLPVSVPTTYELVINPAAAERIGVAIPESMRRRAKVVL